MKKFAIGAVVFAIAGLVAAPAMAEFTAYGSARMATFVNDTDGDTDLQWALQSNSRFGASFKTEDIQGRFEVGTGVNLRLLFATYNMGEMGTVLIGQTYNPYTFFSDQAHGSDNGFIGYGALYDGRRPQIKLTMPFGLTIALISPSATGGDDTFLPKIAVSYALALDMVKLGFNVAVNAVQNTTTYNDDETIVSGLASVNGAVQAGPAAIKFNVFAGQNLGNFGILGLPSANVQNDNGDVEDTANLGGFVQAAFDAGMAKITGGVGYTVSDNDVYNDPDGQISYFVQGNIPIAKTFFVVPEFSYYDMMDDENGNEEDDMWGLGAKWQMNF